MLKIRLQRIGRRHDPQFRVVVIDSRRGPKSNNFIELVGSYNAKAGEIKLKEDRIKHWLDNGAQASDTVHNFLIRQDVIKGEMRNALPKKTPIVKEPTEEEIAAKQAAEEAAKAPAEEAPVESVEAPAETEEKTEAPAEAEVVEEKAEEKAEEKVEEPAAEEEKKEEAEA